MPARTIGPFQIERQIGVGGMGLVYSAIYPRTGKRVAVKILSPGLMSDPKLMKRFEREIEILKRLNHPNIVRYYGGGTENNQRYYAMEYLDKGSLQQVLKERGRLSWEKAILIGRQVSSALEHAHNAGIIHRDLKPANLFLSTRGRLKLGDFGIARDTEATALTAAGKTVGTYAYMAPEQIQAGFPISGKTDLYALGCLLYEVLVGETPFQSDNPMDMLMQHLNDDPYDVCEKVPDCPPELDQLIGRLLAKNPEDRPYDALAVHTELGEIRDRLKAREQQGALPLTVPAAQLSSGGAASATGGKPAKKKKKKKKKKKREHVPFHERTWFLVTCLVLLLGATLFLLRPHGEDWYRDHWREAMRQGEFEQREALEDYIDPYLEAFPEGKFRQEALELSDELHANKLEAPLKNYLRTGNAADSHPFEDACAEAIRKEDEEGLVYVPTWDAAPAGDLKTNPLPAMQRWRRLILLGEALLAEIEELEQNIRAGTGSAAARKESGDGETEILLKNRDRIRWLTVLCRNHHEYLRQKLIDAPAGRRFVHDRMQAAEQLMAGSLDEQEQAREIWRYCATEFEKVERFRDFAQYASKRLNGEEVPVPSADEPENPQPETKSTEGKDGT